MDKNIFIGQAMEDIQAGDAVVIDAETGKIRKATQTKWKLSEEANVTYEKRVEINEYIDRTLNTKFNPVTQKWTAIIGSCPKEEAPTKE